MGVYYFNQDKSKEQALGGQMLNNQVRVYVVDRNKPTVMIDLGGHRIDDAFDLQTTEPLILKEYVFQNGINTVIETQVTDEVVKSVTFDLQLPSKSISVVDRLAANQKNRTYDMFFVPENCDTACDRWFWLGRDVKFNKKRPTNGISGFDDNQAQIEMSRPVRMSGEVLQYLGLQVFPAGKADANTDIVVDLETVYSDCDSDCEPTIYMTANSGTTGRLVVSTDGGKTNTQYTNANLTKPLFVKYNGVVPVVVGGGGVAGATGFFGAYFNGTTLVSSIVEGDNTGVFDAVLAAGAITNAYETVWVGVGTALFKSCDNGRTFSEVNADVSVGNIQRLEYDKANNALIITTSTFEKLVYNIESDTVIPVINSGEAFPAASAVSAIAFASPTHLLLGFADGSLYEAYDWDGVEGTFVIAANFANDVLDISANDVLGYRVLVSEGTSVWVRDLNTKMEFELVQDLTDIVSGVLEVNALDLVGNSPEEGENFFYAGASVTAAGDVNLWRISSCGRCLDLDC